MEVLVLGIATAFNFIIILWKFKAERTGDAVLDGAIMGIIAFLFSGTVTGMAIGMVASAIVSLYLLISPPNLDF